MTRGVVCRQGLNETHLANLRKWVEDESHNKLGVRCVGVYAAHDEGESVAWSGPHVTKVCEVRCCALQRDEM
jgi:hypothetical protein